MVSKSIKNEIDEDLNQYRLLLLDKEDDTQRQNSCQNYSIDLNKRHNNKYDELRAKYGFNRKKINAYSHVDWSSP